MTTTANLSPAFVQLFDSEVHQAYQGNAVLQNVRRMRTGVVGNTENFPKIGKGQATPANSVQTWCRLIQRSHPCQLVCLDFCRIRKIAISSCKLKINFDELQRALAIVVGSAIGRRQDQIIIDAINAASRRFYRGKKSWSPQEMRRLVILM